MSNSNSGNNNNQGQLQSQNWCGSAQSLADYQAQQAGYKPTQQGQAQTQRDLNQLQQAQQAWTAQAVARDYVTFNGVTYEGAICGDQTHHDKQMIKRSECTHNDCIAAEIHES